MELSIAPELLEWRGPRQTVTRNCSVITCRHKFHEDEVPLRMWSEDGSAVAFCDDCVAKYFRNGDAH